MKKLGKISLILGFSAILTGCAAVVAGGAATGVAVAQDRRSAGTILDDNALEMKASKAIHETIPSSTPMHISVVSYNNNVLLIGQAPNEQVRLKAEESVKRIAQVHALHNEIQINEPIPFSVRTSDTWITTKIKSEMLVRNDLNPTRVKVITEDGVVYLLGIVKKEEEMVAVDIARKTKGVKRVVKMFEYLSS